MYELNDTIVAVSSPTSDERVIVRIAGPAAIPVVNQIFNPPVAESRTAIISGSLAVDDKLKIDAKVYLFAAPNSYTGDHLAEIHIHTNTSVIEALIAGLLRKAPGTAKADNGVWSTLRMAGPGEFTARRFLNGKIDLAQAEAVAEVVASSNKFQLAAAEKLLSGRLGETTAKICSQLMDCLSLIEAGLDFSQEDIEFITQPCAIDRLAQIKGSLEQLLAGSIHYESLVDLPAVGIAGAPNAGKSSLLNSLLGTDRSIVSDRRKTTRDVLAGPLTLPHCRAVLFDCAGLIRTPNNILDELAQQAANEALRNSSVVVFCVDISKADWNEDLAIRKIIQPEVLVPAATKSDLLSKNDLAKRIAELNKLFNSSFLSISVETSVGIEQLKDTIDKKIIELAAGTVTPQTMRETRDTRHGIALTARHKQAVTGAIDQLNEAIDQLRAGSDEVAAMLLRAAYQAVSNIERENVDEQILERIFQRFCIGK